MKEIFQYTDWRVWIKSAQEEFRLRKPAASWRWIAQRCECDPGNLMRSVQGRSPLPANVAERLGDVLGLAGEVRSYWLAMVGMDRAKSARETWEHWKTMQALRGVQVRLLEDAELQYFFHWRHAAIRSLLSIQEFHGDWEVLGAQVHPPVSAEEARESVDLLVSLGMVRADPNGAYRVVESFVGTDAHSKASVIRFWQHSMVEQAQRALEEIPPVLREISATTLTLPTSALPAFAAKVREFRRELLRMSTEFQDDDAVYQFNVQLFPVGFLHAPEQI